MENGNGGLGGFLVTVTKTVLPVPSLLTLHSPEVPLL